MQTKPLTVATVSTRLPLTCGIATYASDLCDALSYTNHLTYVLHYGGTEIYECDGEANVSSAEQLRALARHINASGADVVNLQHEFGIWGGPNGEHIFDFLTNLVPPVVSTLHTTFGERKQDSIREEILGKIARESTLVVVLTPESACYARTRLGLPSDRIVQVPHGVPNIEYCASTASRQPHVRLRLASIGYLRPDKGIDNTIRALRALADIGYEFEYVIAGAPQPQFAEQLAYAEHLVKLVDELQLSENVTFRREFLPLAGQIQTIQASDLAIFAYQTPFHSSSGAIPLALACGRPVLCTPIAYACEKSSELGPAVFLTSGYSYDDIASSLLSIYRSSENLVELGELAWKHARNWNWATVADSYFNAFKLATASPRAGRSDACPGISIKIQK